MFPPYSIDRETLTRLVQRKLAEVSELGPERVLLENPGKRASFPVCVLSNFQARPRYQKAAYALSINLEIWADSYYQAEALYDKAAQKLAEYNFMEASPTPQQRDSITGKQRYGSTFEAGWNAIDNTFYVNRS